VNSLRNKNTVGLQVKIVEKHNQGSGKLTEGTTKDILTNSPSHSHGIKVCLQRRKVGLVKHILKD
jgi:uncharacterized repeat protein (TIGR03833 family)